MRATAASPKPPTRPSARAPSSASANSGDGTSISLGGGCSAASTRATISRYGSVSPPGNA